MAIRLRKINDTLWTAWCAAEVAAKPGDVYIDDGQHEALAEYWRENYTVLPKDWKSDA